MEFKSEAAPVVAVFVGSATAQVAVFASGDKGATIATHAYVVRGADMGQKDLLGIPAARKCRHAIWCFRRRPGRGILFQHAIVGSTADNDVLKASVMAVALTADDYDDKIVSQWGGRREVDE